MAACRSLLAFLLVFIASSVLAQQSAAAPTDTCNLPAPDPNTSISLPGHPFGSAVTKDGCWIFVAISADKKDMKNGIAMLRRSGGAVTLEQVFPLPDVPLGLALTHDDKLLIVADSSYVVYMDVDRMIVAVGNPLAGVLHDKNGSGSIEVSITSDSKLLFVANVWQANIEVIDLQKVRAANFSADGIIGFIPVGGNPVGMAFSADEKLLYTTSEGPPALAWPPHCSAGVNGMFTAPRRGYRSRGLQPEGAVTIIDVARAAQQPDKATVGAVPAGCLPGRLAVSPRGDYVYVTARADDALLIFDAAALARGLHNARVGQVPVGSQPVPVAVVDGGKRILVGNSNPSGSREKDRQDVLIIDAAKVASGKGAVLGKIRVGSFPREFSQSADGKILLVSNFNSNSLEVLDLERLPVKIARK